MQARPKNRKQQIVETAFELMKTQGFDSLSYLDIARELGVTKASIHHHFPKKVDLGLALCESFRHWLEKTFANIRRQEGTSSLARLEHYFGVKLLNTCGQVEICALSSTQTDTSALPPAMRSAIREIDEVNLAFVTELLREGRASGELNFPGTATNQALVVSLTLQSAMHFAHLHGDSAFDNAMSQIKLLLIGNSAATGRGIEAAKESTQETTKETVI